MFSEKTTQEGLTDRNWIKIQWKIPRGYNRHSRKLKLAMTSRELKIDFQPIQMNLYQQRKQVKESTHFFVFFVCFGGFGL